jgi:hypothetical protein
MDRRSASSALTRGLAYVAAVCCAGLLCACFIWSVGAGVRQPGVHNIFWFLFSSYEPAAFLLLLAAGVLLRATWLRESAHALGASFWARTESLLRHRLTPHVIAVITLLTAAVGWWTVYHAYAFSMDEYGAVFQARIFASGQIMTEVPARWLQVVRSITPVFVNYDPAQHTWISAYLPVYAWLRAPFEALAVGGLCNPLLAAASVLLVAAIAGQLWPSWSCARGVAALLLATSTQFLVTSMGAYAMSAHLAFNLLWMWLYLRDTRGSWLALPWCGVLAMGLHQFVPHALFAAPLLLRVLRQRRWWWSGYFAGMYAISVVLWWLWRAHFSDAGLTPAVAAFFGVPGFEQLFRAIAHLSIAFSWQSLGLGLLFVVGLSTRSTDRHAALLSDLKLSVALTWLGYMFVLPDQGHGWGYRYIYAVLGNAVIIATFGAHELAQTLRDVRALRLVVSGALVALCVQLPLRLFEVDEVVGPFARASADITQRSAEAVLVPVDAAWYGQDLIRNDPLFREGPVVIGTLTRLTALNKQPTGDGKRQVVRPEELARAGLVVPTTKPELHSQADQN